mgnify:CR=1 FL=1
MKLFKRRNKEKNKDDLPKQRLTHQQKKKLKAQQRRAAKRKSRFKGARGFLDEGGYVEYDGYLKVKGTGKYISFYDAKVRYGTNNNEAIGWYNKFLPSATLKDGDVWFALREKGMDKSTENDVLGKRVHSRKATMEGQKQSTDIRENAKKQSEYKDILLTEELSKDDTVIDSDCILAITSNSPEGILKTEKELRQNYKDDGKRGLMLVRRTAQQMDTLKNIFHTTAADVWHNSDVTKVASTRLFLPSSGFADELGRFAGYDVHAYIDESVSLIDFYGIRNAVIITGGTQAQVSIGGREGAVMINNAGSAWAHMIADSNYISGGNRNHHIVLVPFGGYHEPDARIFDMNKETINTLEVFGDKETVERDFNNNMDKITEIVMMLLGDKNQDPVIRSMFQSQYLDWFLHRARGTGMYTDHPTEEPTKAWQALATTNHKNYPRLIDLVTEMNTLENFEAKKGELNRQKAEQLKRTLQTSSKRYPQVFSSYTTIPDTLGFEDRNIYYDLSTIPTDDPMVKGAIFLNTLAYATGRAMPGDEIIIHGIDSITINPDVLARYREKLNNLNVGVVTTFEKRNNAEMNIETLNSFVEPLASQDMVILGGLTNTMIDQVQSSWGRELSGIVLSDLQARNEGQFYVYRKRDMTNAVIDTHLVLLGGGKIGLAK